MKPQAWKADIARPSRQGRSRTRAGSSVWLIHYDPSADRKALRVRAQPTFSGLVEVAEDGMELVL